MHEYPTKKALEALSAQQVAAVWERWSQSKDQPAYQSARDSLIFLTEKYPLDPDVGTGVDHLAAAYPQQAAGLVEAVVLAALAGSARQELSSEQHAAVVAPWRSAFVVERPGQPAPPPPGAQSSAPSSTPPGQATGGTPWAPAGGSSAGGSSAPQRSPWAPPQSQTQTRRPPPEQKSKVGLYAALGVGGLIALSSIRGCETSAGPEFDFEFGNSWGSSTQGGGLVHYEEILSTPTSTDPTTIWAVTAVAEGGDITLASVDDLFPRQYFVTGCEVSIEEQPTAGSVVVRAGGYWYIGNMQEGDEEYVVLRAEGEACQSDGLGEADPLLIGGSEVSRTFYGATSSVSGELSYLDLEITVDVGDAPDSTILISDVIPSGVDVPDCELIVDASTGDDSVDLDSREWQIEGSEPYDYHYLFATILGEGCPAPQDLLDELLGAGWEGETFLP